MRDNPIDATDPRRLPSVRRFDPMVVVIVLPATAVAELFVFARLSTPAPSDEGGRGVGDDAPAVLAA